jgi:hypothetical protein
MQGRIRVTMALAIQTNRVFGASNHAPYFTKPLETLLVAFQSVAPQSSEEQSLFKVLPQLPALSAETFKDISRPVNHPLAKPCLKRLATRTAKTGIPPRVADEIHVQRIYAFPGKFDKGIHILLAVDGTHGAEEPRFA